MGLRSFGVNDFVDKLTARLTLDGTPDLLVFNSGIHDFCGQYDPGNAANIIASYSSQVDAVLTLLRRIVGANCTIVWKSTNPGVPRLQSFNELLNEAAHRVLQLHAAYGAVAQFDDFPLTLPMWTLGHGIADDDTNHCSTVNKQHELVAVGYACVTVAGALALLPPPLPVM